MSIGHQHKDTVRFGDFELNHSGELRSHGRKIKLQRSGKIVTREDLRQKIWPSDTFVDLDRGINNVVKRLREALGDIAETPRFIETHPIAR